MNLVSLLISTGLNVFYVPFSDNGDLNSIESRALRVFFPFSVFKDTPVCETLTLPLGNNKLRVTTLPRGPCSNCCPIKIARDIKFTLYNHQHSKGKRISVFARKKGGLKGAGWQPQRPSVIYIHGFSESSPGSSGQAMVDAYLSRSEGYNIIVVDWGNLATFPWYRTAVGNVKLVGKTLADFIQFYNETEEISLDNLHVVGFSLGSHIASVTGKRLATSGLSLRKITALDPAYPEFPLNDRHKRLSETDAEYVEVIHTDAGGFGFPLPIGHADFFPNGGKSPQPGCQPSIGRAVDHVVACSHVRAWKLYAESVKRPRAFPSTRSQNCVEECKFDAFMGFANWNSTGQFYLSTNFKQPYGKGPS